jgi:hypothetical protein
MGPPEELVLLLKRECNLRVFVETGTYYGGTAVWAASHFDHVITIEFSKALFDQNVAKHGSIDKIDFIFGDSRSMLKAIIPTLTEPAFFWLDSHWSGDQTYGANDQCPLIDELGEINKSATTHFLFIDDARLFASPPPLPNRIEFWPSIDRVLQAIQVTSNKYYIVIFEDVIIAVPFYAKPTLVCYCQDANTRAWQERAESSLKDTESPSMKRVKRAKRITTLLERCGNANMRKPISFLRRGSRWL